LVLANDKTGTRSSLEMRNSHNESSLWQRYTDGRVIIDTTTSNQHLLNTLSVVDFGIDGVGTTTESPHSKTFPSQSLDIADSAAKGGSSGNSELLLLCRGYVPAYLVSSGVHATGILISQLRPPIMEIKLLWTENNGC
jgi:hypothetical protein